jgi:hypothetical protein
VRDLFGTPLPGALDSWTREVASRDSLQARMAMLALTPGVEDRPDADMISHVFKSDWSLFRLFFPTSGMLRERFCLAATENVLPAYLRLMGQRLRNSPTHLLRIVRFARALFRPRRWL